jgi:hypothetical protein
MQECEYANQRLDPVFYMKIIDINEEYTKLYCKRLEDWSDEIKEGACL